MQRRSAKLCAQDLENLVEGPWALNTRLSELQSLNTCINVFPDSLGVHVKHKERKCKTSKSPKSLALLFR
jgi:hypothetical protein